MGDSERFEYIVVGSGAGGGPLAANLALAGHKVLLLEAGGDDEPYDYQVPVFHPLASEDPALRWDFFVRHYADPERQRRDSKYVPEHDGVLYPRCATLGGCTAHNAMITVYPHERDWDEVAELVGDDSWRAENMRGYFERLENCHYHPVWRALYTLLRLNPTRRGFGGWLHTELPDPTVLFKDKQLLELVFDAAKEASEALGHPWPRIKNTLLALGDPNDDRLVRRNAEGLRLAPLATHRGRRNGSREYIRQVQRMRPENLIVRTHALATRVLLDETNTAVGVEYLAGEKLYRAHAQPRSAAGLEPVQVQATREVILAGGAFNTPQLLKLSGIGPAEELREHGIPLRVELPGVGENLQDRYEVAVVTRMKKDFGILEPATLMGPGPGEQPDPYFRLWETKGKGLYTSNGAVLALIKRSAPEKALPDLFIFGLAGKFRGYYPGYSRDVLRHKNYFTWAILKAHTENRAGRVRLRSADPTDTPLIDFHYFDEGSDAKGEDLEAVVHGVEVVRRIQSRYADLIEEEETPGPACQSREQLREFIENEAWGHHASCSCKIGREDDPMAVLDGDFRVRGVRNLRVVDASVFPKIPGFFIVTSVYMISEKASDVILADARRNP